MYSNPRVKKMLSQEDRDKVVKLGSFQSISVSWDGVAIFLYTNKPSFDEDSKFLHKLGFFKVRGSQGKFMRNE